MNIDRKRINRVFNEYVDNYNSNDGKIKLKINHTLRVSKLCEEIAIKLGFSKNDRDIAYLIGLLHDIGRFEQVKRYGTFVDAKSINHAELGVDILFNQGRIRDYIDDDSNDELIKLAILYHNVYEIPDGLSEPITTYAKLIRDADKTDIFRVNVTEPAIDVYGHDEEDILNSVVSDKVIESFKRRETVPREFKRTAVDDVVAHIAFIFGIYFNESLKIVQEQGYFNELIMFKSNVDLTNMQFDDLRKEIKEYIRSRLWE